MLELELDLFGANDRIKYLENKLKEKSTQLDVARKANRYKREMENLESLPVLHSAALNVSAPVLSSKSCESAIIAFMFVIRCYIGYVFIACVHKRTMEPKVKHILVHQNCDD